MVKLHSDAAALSFVPHAKIINVICSILCQRARWESLQIKVGRIYLVYNKKRGVAHEYNTLQ